MVSFAYREFAVFPELLRLGDTWSSNHQHSFGGIVGADDEPYSELRYDGPSDHSDFERIVVTHEWIYRHEMRFQNQHRSHAILRAEFCLYLCRSKGFYLAQTNRTRCRQLDKRFCDADIEAGIREVEVDIVALQKVFEQQITGGWFTKCKLGSVRTAAIFGDELVTASEDWSHYNKSGECSSLNVDLDIDGDSFSVMMTRHGNVVVRRKCSESLSLEIASRVVAVMQAHQRKALP